VECTHTKPVRTKIKLAL